MLTFNCMSYFFAACLCKPGRRQKDFNVAPPKPWMVFLQSENGGYCSGILYTESLVITTASCGLKGKYWKAFTNVQQIHPKIQHGFIYDVLKRIDHEEYKEEVKHNYDISVWWINGKSNKPTNVILDDGKEVIEREGKVDILGWGDQNQMLREYNTYISDKSIPVGLLWGFTNLISDIECGLRFSGYFKPTYNFCFDNGYSRQSLSYTDNGGPVYRIKNTKIVLLGITSLPGNTKEKIETNIAMKISEPNIKDFINYHVRYFKPENIINGIAGPVPPHNYNRYHQSFRPHHISNLRNEIQFNKQPRNAESTSLLRHY